MPPISNYPLYLYRVFAKWLSFFVFGLGTLLIIVLLLPVMTLIIHPKERFAKLGRRLISFLLRVFTNIMRFMRVVRMDVDDREAYRRLSSKIIVLNHPSLLDVVMILSLVPNAVCIAKGYLMNRYNICRGIVRRLYIPNSLDFSELSAACLQSLEQGYCLVIFPEGTRTPRGGGALKLKKGAARLSIASGCGIIPVHIGGTDKWGLGKHDPWTAYNHTEEYVYRIRMQDELSPGIYADLENFHAVRRLNEDIRKILTSPMKV
ncbi:acyltransferase [Spirochaetia bacterium]|nr:acyltransferase [Spirochaetia bacterium]